MKKVLQVSIGDIAFSVEEDAYNKLRKYLNELKNNFSHISGEKELMNDIENRIAELLTKRKSGSDKPVNVNDIDFIIASVGSSEQIAESIGDSYEKGNFKNWFRARKIVRDSSNQTIAGVCSGIGLYFNVDPIFIRILALLGIFLGVGTTIIIYIILWIIIPKSTEITTPKYKRLFRRKEKRVLGGVCTGLEYLTGLDKILYRIFFLLLVLFFGTGVLMYIIFWILTPKAKDTVQLS